MKYFISGYPMAAILGSAKVLGKVGSSAIDKVGRETKAKPNNKVTLG
jgi:hypothetical protein